MQILTKRKKQLLAFTAALVFLVAWGFIVYKMGARSLVESIGVENSYILMFFVALVGGLSSLTAPSFFTVLGTLAIGGLNPFLLGLSAGMGLFLSDSFFYFVGSKGRHLFTGKWEKRRERLEEWLDRKPNWVTQLLTYLYTGFTPFPNDVLMVALAVVDAPYRRIMLPLFLGNVTLGTITAFLAQTGIQLFG